MANYEVGPNKRSDDLLGVEREDQFDRDILVEMAGRAAAKNPMGAEAAQSIDIAIRAILKYPTNLD